MSDRPNLRLGIATAVPAAAGAIAAGAMTAWGDQRLLALDIALPGAVLLCGIAVSAVPAAFLIGRVHNRRIASRREEAVREAVEADAAQERQKHQRFLARLDHELKNPLTALRATAASSQETTAWDSVQTAAWRTVDAQTTKLSTLLRDLRKLAEIDTRPLELEPVDLEKLVRESITALDQQNPVAGARVSFIATRAPWPVPMLEADLDLLSLALDNVLGNAAKYSTTGPIEVRLREQDGWAVLEVADTGRGIPAEEMPYVFDELARARNARDVGGSGIGLSLVAVVLRNHGGEVSLRSVEGSGTVLTLRLPIRR